MPGLNRREFLMFAVFCAAGQLMGCAKTTSPERPASSQSKEKEKKKKRKKDPRLTQPWPKEYKKPDFSDPSCAIPRFVADSTKEDGVARNEKGEPLIEGLSSPWIRLSKNTEKIVYQTLFCTPVTPSQLSLKTCRSVTVVTDEESLEKARETLKDASKKEEQARLLKQARAFDLATQAIKIMELQKQKGAIHNAFSLSLPSRKL